MTLLCMSQRCQWLRCAHHSGVNHSAVQVTAKSDFWWVFFKNSQDLGGLLMNCFDRIHPSHLYYKRGVEPQVKPRVWHPKICAQLWLHCACHSDVNDSAMQVTVVSMTPPNFYRNLHHCTAVSITPLCISQRCQLFSCAHHRGVHDSALHVTAASMTPLCKSQRCEWHRCATIFSDFLGEY
jgi:hypothetical protein